MLHDAMGVPIPSLFNRFALGLSSCVLMSIALLAEEPAFSFLEEATQLKAKILDSQKTEHEFPNVAKLPFQKGLPDPFLMPNGKRVSTPRDWRRQREYLKANAGRGSDENWRGEIIWKEEDLSKLYLTMLHKLGVESESFGGATGTLTGI